ncbi:MAG: YdcF family protein [Candidatus Margulisbacteria bacterium]|nr:YdcF family protein [Candidatus Margulisiibacteriota bacterium]MBU1021100.1 YdcF family protein [Candidatus Margulisiibacteriota bacterium]MBU1728655.1 YdcF family protein [Candidatus Margulisiibacteriota bacterium]MBU1955106.1 YdcF family protein [Candidatus Margulisiibacteriota bacterium]
MLTNLLKHRLVKWVLIGLIVIVVLFSFKTSILQGLSSFLVIAHPLEKADAIVVLGGENGERVYSASNLYKKGYAPLIILTGGNLAWRLSEVDVMKKQALFYGIPASKIITENKSLSTLENAKFIMPILKERGIEKIILVTSPYHMRRAYQTFNKQLRKEKIDVIAAPVPPNKYTTYNPNRWWERHEDKQFVIMEYIKLFSYFVKRYI